MMNREIRNALILGGTVLAALSAATVLMAGTQGYQTVTVGAGLGVTQPPASPAVQVLRIQEPRISWQPKIDYQEREIQIPVPPPVQIISSLAQTIQAPTVQMQVPTMQPQVQTYQTMPTFTVPQVATYQSSSPVQYQVNPCPGGVCPVPVDVNSFQYQPAAVTVNGQTRQIDVPLRGRLQLKRAFSTPNFR